jgi:dTDP-4-dehydrorhamnose reductase
MLGIDLCALLEQAGHAVVRTDVGAREGMELPAWEPLDITDLNAVTTSLKRHRPDFVVHGAAYTDVDGCERNPDLAFRINAMGTWNLAAICGADSIPLAYISTDFVFDGAKGTPYTEFDPTHPISHYGASKLAGEKTVAQLCRQHFIVRTQWLYGVHGKCFPAVMIRLAATQPEIRVVCDQVGSPTSTLDLSRTLITLLDSPLYGTYHVANAGECAWCTLARKTLDLAGFQSVHVIPIPSSEWPSPTQRPAYSVLRRYALELQGRDNLPHWEHALAEYIERRNQGR